MSPSETIAIDGDRLEDLFSKAFTGLTGDAQGLGPWTFEATTDQADTLVDDALVSEAHRIIGLEDLLLLCEYEQAIA